MSEKKNLEAGCLQFGKEIESDEGELSVQLNTLGGQARGSGYIKKEDALAIISHLKKVYEIED